MDNDNLISPDPRPTRADAVKNREAILETAQRLFDKHGVENVSMTMVADAAGVGKGTLYRHFENKISLCVALLDQTDRVFQNRTLERLRAIHDPLDNLRWFVGELVQYVEANHALLCFGGATMFPPLEHPVRIWWRQTILGLLRQLRPAGDVEYLADTLFVMVDVRTFLFQHVSLGYSPERILDGLFALIDTMTQ